MVTHSYTTITGTQPLITLAQAKKQCKVVMILFMKMTSLLSLMKARKHLLRILSIVLLLKGIS
jgi:hypothetical protein